MCTCIGRSFSPQIHSVGLLTSSQSSTVGWREEKKWRIRTGYLTRWYYWYVRSCAVPRVVITSLLLLHHQNNDDVPSKIKERERMNRVMREWKRKYIPLSIMKCPESLVRRVTPPSRIVAGCFTTKTVHHRIDVSSISITHVWVRSTPCRRPNLIFVRKDIKEAFSWIKGMERDNIIPARKIGNLADASISPSLETSQRSKPEQASCCTMRRRRRTRRAAQGAGAGERRSRRRSTRRSRSRSRRRHRYTGS